VFVNNQPATVAVLKQLAPELALVHAQTETLSSFDHAQQRILLDRFAGVSTDAVAAAYAGWRTAEVKLNDLLEGEQDRLRMVDLWSYQRKEIEGAHLVAGEDEALETEKRVLGNAEKLYGAATGAFEQLYEEALQPRWLCGPHCATWKSWRGTTTSSPRPFSNWDRRGLQWRRGCNASRLR